MPCTITPATTTRPARRPLRFLARLRLWRQIRRERRDLAQLDERMLHDIGLRPDDARREADRPFWDIGSRR